MSDEVLAVALRAIGRKERTEAEMRDWLAAREYDQTEIDRVLDYLIENLAVDDERYAAAFTADKRQLSGWGRERIEATLVKRGVSRDLVHLVLAEDDGESEVDRATRVLTDRDSSLDDARDRQRALGLLARRGFSAEDAYAAIRRASKAADRE